MYHQYQPSSRNLRTVDIPMQNSASVGVQLLPDELRSFSFSCHVRAPLSACLRDEDCRQVANHPVRAPETISLLIDFAAYPRFDDRKPPPLLSHDDCEPLRISALRWRIDPHGSRQCLGPRPTVGKALWITSERITEDLGTPLVLQLVEPVVDIVGREQPEPDMMMLGGVPAEEVAAARAPVPGRAEAVQECSRPLRTASF